MSSVSLLVGDLQSLASETRRKHPDVREAAEKALAILRNLDEGANRHVEDGPHSEDLLKPVFMGCATKNTKVISISLGSLQRLITLKAVPQSAVPTIISTMNDCMSQGVDIQLRILQTLLSLITNFPAIHGDLLGDALLLCFKMQESRIAVVSSTAAATLRQIVMFIIDKVDDEDKRDNLRTNELRDTVLPDGTHKMLGPSALDSYSVVEDLCLLANSEKPHFLKLGSLPKTFALELIESVMTNYHHLFRKHSELLTLLQHHLCPLLLKLLSDKPIFPLTLRSTRVVFLLLKQFSEELVTEAEVFLALLVRIIGGDIESGSSDNLPLTARPHWMRVLAMEIIRGLCNDAELMRRVWERYDTQEGGSKLFGSLISVLKRLVTEKPALLGVSSQMFGVGVSSHQSDVTSSSSSSGFDVGAVAGMVANAASSTVTGVMGMMGPEHGLNLSTSAMRIQCIDQLDKADAPPIPDAYIYLLGLQSLVSLCEGFASITLPLFNNIVVQRSRAAGENTVRAPPSLDLTVLPEDQLSTRQLKSVHGMIEEGWPGLLAALSFIIATNLSDDLFEDVLRSYQNMANVSGILGLTTPRDAFLTSLAKFAIPSRVVSSIDTYAEPLTPRAANALTDSFSALAGAVPLQPPGLSERNIACLKVLISSALYLAGSLGPAWYNVLEALQNADYVLTARASKTAPSAKRLSSINAGSPGKSSSVALSGQQAETGPSSRHPLLADADGDSVQRAMQRLLDSSKNMDDLAFHDFVTALCKLSAEMINMQSPGLFESDSADTVPSLSPQASLDSAHRRRVSGIHLPRTLRSGDFGINKLGSVSRLNILRFTHRSPDVAWTTVMSHLIFVARNRIAPHPIRLQAARTLDEILLVVPRNIGSSEERRRAVQRLLLDVLAEQILPSPLADSSTTLIEIRKMGLETLHQILQSAGHTLLLGWETIFEMLGSVCEPNELKASQFGDQSVPLSPALSPKAVKSPPLGYAQMPDRGNNSLVRIAFQSLTLVCDSLTILSTEHLRLCISTIGKFGRQPDTNISLTAAGSLLWGVSDSIQAKRKDSGNEAEYSNLWMLLLLELLGLCSDTRSEVRVGAIQTLFRTLQLYGATLSLETWEECVWKVTFPLIESITDIMKQTAPSSVGTIENATALGLPPDSRQAWDESKTLALQSVSSIFGDFLTTKIMQLDSFEKVWDEFVRHVQTSFMFDSAASCTASLRCLEKAVTATGQAASNLNDKIKHACERTWVACDDMGELVIQRRRPPMAGLPVATPPFDQESLLAFVDVIKSVRAVSRAKEGSEWTFGRLNRLLSILKGVLTYSDSPSFRQDIDALTPVQTAILDVVNDVDPCVTGVASLILRDLSEFLTLAFVGAFDTSEATGIPDSQSSKRVTYIALTKRVMPMLMGIFLRFKDNSDIYSDETMETILASFGVPIKLKYECPAPSKAGNDPPLWKTATTSFLNIVKESTFNVRKLEGSIPNERFEGFWRQLVDVFRGAILADCQHVLTLTLEEQEAEELFDLSLISALEIDVVPYVGDERVPDYIILHLAKMLHQGSLLHQPFDEGSISRSHSSSSSESSVSTKINGYSGTTVNSTVVPRERFSYWCLDLLFLVCSNTDKDEEKLRRRLAALCLPTLLSRCRMTLVKYLGDEALRGAYPFPRAREEELVYVIEKLRTLELWPGSLWAALSQAPSSNCIEQPAIDASFSLSQLIADTVKRSTRAHLFQLYSSLCSIAALPRQTPIAWVSVSNTSGNADESGSGKTGSVVAITTEVVTSAKSSRVAEASRSAKVEELDARKLASLCLECVGKELGVA